MDLNVQKMIDKAKVIADKTGKAAVRVADSAGKKAGEMAQATRINLQIFDLNTECDILYKEIGKIIYDIHCGQQVPESLMEEKLVLLDENREQVADLKNKLTEVKNVCACPNCYKECSNEAVFCPDCGAKL